MLLRYRVIIDGEVAGYLRAGGWQTFAVADGVHRVRVKQWFPAASREIDVVVPPGATLTVGPRGGIFTAMFLGFIQPRRCLQLDEEHQPEPRPSRLLVAAGAFVWVAWYLAILFGVHALLG
jgi:hypothetical protein